MPSLSILINSDEPSAKTPTPIPINIGDGSASSLRLHCHSVSGALDRLCALVVVLRSAEPLSSEKRHRYAELLEEAQASLSGALRGQLNAIEMFLHDK
jgi:hypothetical protein